MLRLPVMSTFYLLPPRAVLGQRLIAALGIPLADRSACIVVAEALAKAVEAAGAFVVYRDDLPPDEEPVRALADGFGAETGDEIIEVNLNQPPRRWPLAA